ncbi:MAG: hypothetical protein QOI24_3792 [Acidobacteriota bacterium]|jgi:hypothetical protein|nr:hypothetical protein [Acidobacteriota bacterium]
MSRDAKIALVLAAAAFLLFADVVFTGSGFYYRDVLRDYLPSRLVLRDAVMHGEFPFWNRFWSAGQPLAANPGFQAFYPLTWLVLFGVRGFQLGIVLHLAIAAAGMYFFLRSLALREEPSIFGAIAFAFGGCMLSLTNLVPFLTSIVWWPAILCCARRRNFTGFTLSLAMLLLAAEQAAILQTAVLVVIAIVMSSERRKLLIGCVAAFAIASVQLIPALDLKRDVARSRPIAFDDAMAWSMPLDRPLELFYAHAFGRITEDGAEYSGARRYAPPRVPLILSIYCGLVTVLLAMAGIVHRSRGWKIALALMALSFLVAAGAQTPLGRALYNAGLFHSIRYPEKFVLAGVFAMIVLAAIAFDAIVRNRRVAIALIAITGVELAYHSFELAPRKPAQFFEPPPIVNALRGDERVFHLAVLPGSGMRFPGGDQTYEALRGTLVPFMPASYGIATAYEPDINLTTLLPTAELMRSVWELRAPVPLLRMGNVGRVIVPAPAGGVRVQRIETLPSYWFADRLVVARNREEIARALSAIGPRTALVDVAPFVPAPADVLSVSESRNGATLRVRASATSFLVASVTRHRYWHIAIDGREADTVAANIAYQGIVVPAGEHVITMRYRNPLIVAFGIVSLIALAAALLRRYPSHKSSLDQTGGADG